MSQRILLTGALLLIPQQHQFLRLVFALLLSLVFLVLTLLEMPFRRLPHDYLSCTANFAIVCIFVGALMLKLYDDLEDYLPEDTVGRILGVGNPDTFVAVLIAFTLGFLSIIMLTFLQQLAQQRSHGVLLCESTGARPVLLLFDGCYYHSFLSHIWSTGQDQVALIKKRLQQLLPGVRVFLDVDDLEDAGRLEVRPRDSK